MIFKKPYAFFIKSFKIFHLIIFFLSAILLYRTSLLYSFMREYVKDTPNVIGKDLTTPLFANWVYILIGIILIVNIIIIIVMIRKEKPYMYYTVNIILYISVLVVYIISHGIISDLQEILVETKIVMAIRDILNIARMLQTISVIFYLIRATGFDIKKFDFVRDLHSLNISEEDSEEYEVAIELEQNVAIRNLKRILRNTKYYYQENKFIINALSLLLIGIILITIYLSIDKYDKLYKETEYINVNHFSFGIKESYITTKDYKGEDIKLNDKVLVVLKLSAAGRNKQALSNSKMILKTKTGKYYSDETYYKYLFDLGKNYNDSEITDEFNDYILIYEIPKKEKNQPMTFEYIDNIEYKQGKTKVNAIDVTLNPIDLDNAKIIKEEYKLTEPIEINNKYGNYVITINEATIAKSFEQTYKKCITSEECYDFKEILLPTLTNNTEKVLLKLDGNMTSEKRINKIIDIPDFIKNFGRIEYSYGESNNIEKNDFNSLKFNRINDTNDYIEINKEILDATNIKLIFKIRNYEYSLVLRGE